MKIEHMERIKALKDILNNDNPNEDEVRAYCIQLEQLLPVPNKTLYIDADSLLFYTAYAQSNTLPEMEGNFIGDADYSYLLDEFQSLVDDVVGNCRLESFKGNMIRFKDYKLVFTPSTNFRYDIFPEYKKSRVDKVDSPKLKYLKSLKHELGLVVEGVEADDVVAYYARRGHPIASGDKDVIYGVEGNNYFYHSKHKCVVNTSKEDAERFVLLQCLAGDSTDDIPGIKGVGMKTKLLPDNATFEDVINIYIDKGYTKEDAILTRRLVGLDQWRGLRRNKIILFEG